jgi:hypothetical protein
MVERISWSEHLRRWTWRQGEHVTLVGPTGCGKTTLALEILAMRRYVVILAAKPEDPVLEQLTGQNWRRVRRWEEVRPSGERAILWPRASDPDELEARQWVEFRACLRDVFSSGRWTIYLDELSYITDYLGLDRECRRIWRQGRSLKLSLVTSTQQPVAVPRDAWDQVMHTYLWKPADWGRIRRMAEISGVLDPEAVGPALRQLGRHDVLYAGGGGELWITRVEV